MVSNDLGMAQAAYIMLLAADPSRSVAGLNLASLRLRLANDSDQQFQFVSSPHFFLVYDTCTDL